MRAFIFEFKRHFHTLPPLIKKFRQYDTSILIEPIYISKASEMLEDYDMCSKLVPLNNFFLLKNFKALFCKSVIVISYAPEEPLAKKNLLKYIFFFITGIDLLCVRNPVWYSLSEINLRRWWHKNALAQNLGILLNNLLLARSKEIVTESSLQTKYLRQSSLFINKKSIVNFPGRASNVTPIVSNFRPQVAISNSIGILGQLNTWKKNYDELIEAIEMIPFSLRPKLVILGGVDHDTSDGILKRLSDVTQVKKTESLRLSEKDFYLLGSTCKYLFFPASKDYVGAWGSGSFADAIMLNRKLLLSDKFKISPEFDKISERYQSISHLSYIIQSTNFTQKFDPDIFLDYSHFLG
jgi:hypothetical protein